MRSASSQRLIEHTLIESQQHLGVFLEIQASIARAQWSTVVVVVACPNLSTFLFGLKIRGYHDPIITSTDLYEAQSLARSSYHVSGKAYERLPLEALTTYLIDGPRRTPDTYPFPRE